jgi:hypothetical protein
MVNILANQNNDYAVTSRGKAFLISTLRSSASSALKLFSCRKVVPCVAAVKAVHSSSRLLKLFTPNAVTVPIRSIRQIRVQNC